MLVLTNMTVAFDRFASLFKYFLPALDQMAILDGMDLGNVPSAVPGLARFSIDNTATLLRFCGN